MSLLHIPFHVCQQRLAPKVTKSHRAKTFGSFRKHEEKVKNIFLIKHNLLIHSKIKKIVKHPAVLMQLDDYLGFSEFP